MANGERIRTMTDEELTEWIDKQVNEDREDWESLGCYHCMYYKTHHQPEECEKCEWKDGILRWLKKEK